MNQLSVILYFADIAMNLMNTIFGIGLFFVFSFLIINFVYNVYVSVYNDHHERNTDRDYRKHEIVWKKCLIIGFAMIIISNLIPTRQTMYMIAASEIGETVVLSPEMTETMGKVKTVIDLKLDDVIVELTTDKDKTEANTQ